MQFIPHPSAIFDCDLILPVFDCTPQIVKISASLHSPFHLVLRAFAIVFCRHVENASELYRSFVFVFCIHTSGVESCRVLVDDEYCLAKR